VDPTMIEAVMMKKFGVNDQELFPQQGEYSQ
jgi:hypothetical protein